MTDATAIDLDALEQKAQAGDAQAQWELACRLSEQLIVEPSVLWLKKAAELGNASAQLILGIALFKAELPSLENRDIFPVGIYSYVNRNKLGWILGCIREPNEADDKLAYSWILKSAEQNFGAAQFALFYFHLCKPHQAIGSQDNLELAVSWLKKAAENSCPEAEFALACAYRSGKGVEQNMALAVALFGKAAKAGSEDAQYELANLYFRGEHVEQNFEAAYEWLLAFLKQQQSWPDHSKTLLFLDELYAKSKGIDNCEALDYQCLVEIINPSADCDNGLSVLGGLHVESRAAEQTPELLLNWPNKYANFDQKKLESLQNKKSQLHDQREKAEGSFLKSYYSNDIWAIDMEIRIATRVVNRLHNLANYCHAQAIRMGANKRQQYLWNTKAAESGHAESQFWLARKNLQGDIFIEGPCNPWYRYESAYEWSSESVKNGYKEANLIVGFLSCFNVYDYAHFDGCSGKFSMPYFEEALGHGPEGVAEYFLAKNYRYSYNAEERALAERCSQKADLDKVWSYFDIDNLLELDSSLCEKLEDLLTDGKLLRQNRELHKLNEQLTLEIREKEKAHEALHEKEREMLSFFTHTMRNALATAPESLRQAIRLLDGGDYEHDAKHYEAINTIASLFSSLTLTDCLIDTFKQSISDPQEFKQAWDSDNTGEATPRWVIASSLRQALNRIFFSSAPTALKKLLAHGEPVTLKAARKSFIDEVLPLDVTDEGVDRLYSWVNTHVQCLEISISDADKLNFGTNRTRFSLLFAITSELILNALKYWNGEDKIQIAWRLVEEEYFVFSVSNRCKANAMSDFAGTRKGLAFIRRLTELLGEQARFNLPEVGTGVFATELMLDKTLFGIGNEHIMD